MTDRLAGSIPTLAHAAAHRLRWCPETFWCATPAELAMALSTPDAAPQTVSRDDLNILMEQDGHGRSD